MTQLPLLILPAAERRIPIAADEDDARRHGLGQRFIAHVEMVIDRIERHPHSFQRLDAAFRRAWVAVFPYAIAYRILPKVVAVFPCRMDPEPLADRLGMPSK